jgi:cell division protein FtsW
MAFSANVSARNARHAQRRETERKAPTAAIGKVDLPFLVLALLLTAIGLVMVFSASFPSAYYETGDAAHYFKRQAIFAVIGVVAMFLISRVNYQRWRGAAKILLGLSIFLLILVLTPLGIERNNAQRWLGFGEVLTFQPSEIAKLAIIVFFADSISKKKRKMESFREGILPYFVLLAVFAGLMLLEPHLSGTILIVGVGVILMIVGGIRAWLVGVGVGGIGLVGVLYVKLVEAGVISYGASRILMWKDPWVDPTGDGFQLCQGLIAIGSGGLLGVGLGKSRQKFLYLPEEHNDYIFAIVCEELGLIGAIVIMGLFMALILRGFWIALHARDRFGTLLVVGIISLIALQTFLNIAVVTGFLPTTGISLPFFSYGGTALAMQLFEIGMVLSVSRQIPAPKAG